MALPSSPPPLPEELSISPPLLPAVSSALLPTAGDFPANRKRNHSDYGSLSSDPVFSEDASEAELIDEDLQPKRKRLVRGPWWNHGRKAGQGLRRGMAKKERMRNADSGVWMGSDASEASIDSVLSSQARIQALDVCDEGAEAKEDVEIAEKLPDPQALAARMIHICLDNGTESVDLSDLGLDNISPSTLSPLHQLIRQPHSSFTEPPSEDEFAPLTPSLQLYLSNNRLTTLPSELFNLGTITVLSLRHNSFTQLEPSIARLRNLRQLNIAGNQLQYLPFEMLGMLCNPPGGDRRFILRPNPFLQPAEIEVPCYGALEHLPAPLTDEGHDAYAARFRLVLEQGCRSTMQAEMQLRFLLARAKRYKYFADRQQVIPELTDELVYIASSDVVYHDFDGRLYLGDRRNFTEIVTGPANKLPPSGETSAAPSLFELALRAAQSRFNLADASSILPADTPRSIINALQKAEHCADYGNQLCSVCGKEFVIARAEWIEYWFYGGQLEHVLTGQNVLPFMRKVCSWACVKPTDICTWVDWAGFHE